MASAKNEGVAQQKKRLSVKEMDYAGDKVYTCLACQKNLAVSTCQKKGFQKLSIPCYKWLAAGPCWYQALLPPFTDNCHHHSQCIH